VKKTDRELVAECLNGNENSFSELVERYKRLIYKIAYRYTQDSDEVNDLVQEAYIKIYKSLSKYDSKYMFSTWCSKVTANICLDHLRRKRIESVPLEEVENFVGSSASPEEYYLSKELSRKLMDAINELPDIYRVPIIMYHQKGMSYKQIAEHLNKPMSIVKNRLFRGRLTLRQNLGHVA